jgi:hypothetical protein
LLSLAFQFFTSAFQCLATSPVSLSFQTMSFLFHHFATVDFIASDPLLLFGVPVYRIRHSCVSGAREKQACSEYDSIKFPIHVQPPGALSVYQCAHKHWMVWRLSGDEIRLSFL